MVWTITRHLKLLAIANVLGVFCVFLTGGYFVEKYGLQGVNYTAYLGFLVIILMLLIDLLRTFVKRSKIKNEVI